MPIAITPPAAPEVEAKQPPQQTSSTTTNNNNNNNNNDNQKQKRKVVIFSDFDGTIFHQDTGHLLFDSPHGCGAQRREQLEADLSSGKRTFRDMSESLWGSLHLPFDDGFQVLSPGLEIDSGFESFHKFCTERDIPFNVISAGLKPVLRRVLDEFLGEERSKGIGILANDVVISQQQQEEGKKTTKNEGEEEGKEGQGGGGGGGGGEWSWKPVWRHQESELGHDKALTMGEVRKKMEEEAAAAAENDGEIPLIIFIGDGVSDLPAAKEADVLFARKGLRLEEHCLANGIDYIPFDSFADIQAKVQEIVGEDEEKTGGKGLPTRFNPRANLWRRMSSKNAVARFAAATPKREDKMFLWPEVYTEVVG